MEQKNLPNEFQMMDVEKICVLKRTRLQTWMERGWIIPSIQKATGHGTRNIFSRDDLYKIMAFKYMLEGGLTREVAAELIKAVEGGVDGDWLCDIIIFTRTGEKVNSQSLLVSDAVRKDKKFQWALAPNLFPSMFEEWDDLYILNFKKIREAVDKRSK